MNTVLKHRQSAKKLQQPQSNRKSSINSFIKQSSLCTLQSYHQSKVIEYQSALNQFTKQQRITLGVTDNLIRTKEALCAQKSVLQLRSKQVDLQRTIRVSQKDSFQKKLIQQQQQLSMLKEQNEQYLNQLDQNRIQNISIISQIQQTNKNNQQHSQQNKKIQSQIAIIKDRIQKQKEHNRLSSETLSDKQAHIGTKQQQKDRILNRIERQQKLISQHTSLIEQKLKEQSQLITRYSQRKASKNELQVKVAKQKQTLKQQTELVSQLQSAEMRLTIILQEKNKLLSLRQMQVVDFQQKIGQTKQLIIQNKNCLGKVQRYLQSLIEQNHRIESKIERVLQEDLVVKNILDSKYKQKYASYISNEATDSDAKAKLRDQKNSKYYKTQHGYALKSHSHASTR